MVVFSDGNTKDSIRVSRNMIYDYDNVDDLPIPDLETF